MKKTAFVLGYAGSILAFAFSILMILTVPLGLAGDILDDVKKDLGVEELQALNETALEMEEQSWSDYSESGLLEIAKEAADKSKSGLDEDVFTDAMKFAYDAGLNAMVSMIVVGAAIVLSLVGLIGTMITKKAPVAGGVMMLLSAFFLLLAAIYTDTLVPTFAASVVLALGGVAAFIPERADRPVTAQSAHPYAAQPYMAPPQGDYPAYAPPQNYGYAPPQGVPQNYGYAPPQGVPGASVSENAPVNESSATKPVAGSGLPFPEEPGKPEEQ